MKGIIFNLLEQFILETCGEEKCDQILEQTPLETKEPFVGPGNYPDKDLFAIVAKAGEELGLSQPEILKRFGRFCIPQLAEKFPDFFKPHRHPKPFLKKGDYIHYIEVVKLYKDAEPPHFTYKDPAPDRLIARYISKRKLCQFMEGLIEGVADYYKSPIQYKQTRCMLNGSEVCEFDLTFPQEEK